eukprot:TRINITY_DN1881_c0_g1_i1.p1 TRINITY_DN1881_c0_g1~~TRINITY_DN1881_c0_g1_i1.p1  ORF type:complete len:441 (+),score=140.24 TRINITY_DN1881_c0_g1_i1:1015-2337(+)
MDKLIGAIHQYSGTSKEADLLLLKKLLEEPANKESLHKMGNLDDAFGLINPASHTVAYVILLDYLGVRSQAEQLKFAQYARMLVAECNPKHLLLVDRHYFSVCHKFASLFSTTAQALSGIRLLHAALVRFQSGFNPVDPGKLTPIHADLLQLCILARTYKFAVNNVLNTEISSVVDYENSEAFLRFFYYAGIVYTGLRNFPKAIANFRMVFSVPANAISAIALEAYKKYLLCSLIESGQVSGTKVAPNMVMRALRPLSAVYQEYVSVYSSHDTDNVHKYAMAHVEAFKKDRNFGLVKQSIAALYRHNVQRQTRTYVTLPLKDIADVVKLPGASAARSLIVRMVEDGQVRASINARDGMVSFSDDAEAYDTMASAQRLAGRIHDAAALDRALKAVDRDLLLDRRYIQRTQLSDAKGAAASINYVDDDDDMARAIALSTANV